MFFSFHATSVILNNRLYIIRGQTMAVNRNFAKKIRFQAALYRGIKPFGQRSGSTGPGMPCGMEPLPAFIMRESYGKEKRGVRENRGWHANDIMGNRQKMHALSFQQVNSLPAEQDIERIYKGNGRKRNEYTGI